MTVVLTFGCPAFVMQISDRLVSVRRADPTTGRIGGAEPFDPLSNKALIFRAADAIVSIGYSGTAYLEDRPTDEWIAEILWGEPLPEPGPWGGTPTVMRGAPVLRGLWPVVRMLCSQLEALAVSDHGLSMTIAGWQAVRETMARPIVIELEREPKKKEVQIIKSPRWWLKSQNVRIYENGGYLKQEDMKALAERLKAAACSGVGMFDAFEGILAETIREISRANPTLWARI
jgi:hypothetical protein